MSSCCTDPLSDRGEPIAVPLKIHLVNFPYTEIYIIDRPQTSPCTITPSNGPGRLEGSSHSAEMLKGDGCNLINWSLYTSHKLMQAIVDQDSAVRYTSISHQKSKPS